MRIFPVCFSCGSLLIQKIGLCSVCLSYVIQPSLHHHPTPQFTLVPWTNQRQAWMSEWIHHLKGNQPSLWLDLATYTLEAMTTHGVFQKIPANSKIFLIDPSQTQDHSYWFAHHLSRLMNAEHLPYFFVKNSRQKQKELSRKARIHASLGYHLAQEELLHSLQNDLSASWLFIDDVITTGSTARTAFHLLNHPKSFMAISWMRRCQQSSMIPI